MCGDDGSIANFGGIGGITTSNYAESFSNNAAVIYPNPTHDFITINYPEIIKNDIIELYNYQGQLVLSEPFNGQLKILNIHNFANGMYFLKLKNDHKTNKVIIEN
jgi:hypothetical protein